MKKRKCQLNSWDNNQIARAKIIRQRKKSTFEKLGGRERQGWKPICKLKRKGSIEIKIEEACVCVCVFVHARVCACVGWRGGVKMRQLDHGKEPQE